MTRAHGASVPAVPRTSGWRWPRGVQLGLLAATLLLALGVAWAEGSDIPAPVAARTLRQPVPLLAYYDLASPSSPQSPELHHQIALARHAGFDGFLVGWAPAPRWDRDLARLIAICDAERFGLGIVLGGVGSSPAAGMRPDSAQAALHYLAHTFTGAAAFGLYAHPLVIWNGTWRYSPDQIADVAGPYRSRFLLLASDASAADFRRISAAVSGDALLQPALDPFSRAYQSSLLGLSTAAHHAGDLWLAPAFPSMRAGKLTIPPRHGATLRRTMDAAVRSSPDAIAVLSWNGWHATSLVATQDGIRMVDVLADIHQAVPPQAGAELDTNLPGTTSGDVGKYTLPVLAATALFMVVAFALVVRRALRSRGDGE